MLVMAEGVVELDTSVQANTETARWVMTHADEGSPQVLNRFLSHPQAGSHLVAEANDTQTLCEKGLILDTETTGKSN